MNKFSGIDLHSNNSVVVVSDEDDRIEYQRRLPNDPLQIRAALAPHREYLVGVVIEATFNWYWLVDELMNDGYRVHLANPAAIRQYEGLKYSGDFTDAAHLAQLLRLGLLPEGNIYPADGRPVRDLSRKRMQLVQCRTAQILTIENLFSRHTGGQMPGERGKRLDEAIAGKRIRLCARCDPCDASQSGSHADVAGRDRKPREAAHGARQTEPGLCFAELGARHWSSACNHDHAGNRNHFAFCQGWQFQFVLPLCGQPAGKQQQEERRRQHKNGNKYLARAFVEAANFAIRSCPEARHFYERKKRARNGIVAIKALAHKLARACYHMLREHKPFEVTRCFG